MEALTRPVFLLTDFGATDHYAGQLRAVIAALAPRAPVHDLSHGVLPFAIDEGAWLLETALEYLPRDAVVLAVVDPGVGTGRRPIVVPGHGRLFVGPDNGLLSGAFPRGAREGSPLRSFGVDVRQLTDPRFRNERVSETFHGRDIFAPAAAWLATGLDYRLLGPPVASATLLPPFCGQPAGFGRLEGYVIHIDRFGSLVTTIRATQLFPAFRLHVGGHAIDTRVRTFAEAPGAACFCHADSSGFVTVAVNGGSAASALGVERGCPVVVEAT